MLSHMVSRGKGGVTHVWIDKLARSNTFVILRMGYPWLYKYIDELREIFQVLPNVIMNYIVVEG